MAQLRDAHTSELVAEGTPLEMVILADEIGRESVAFDGVGLAFDPDLVVKAHRENVAGLKAAAKDEKDARAKESLQRAEAEATASETEAKKRVAVTRKAIDKARARVGG